jgi:hypothetical protein
MREIANRDVADALLSALAEQLAAADERFELVVIGGSGLLALGLVERSTRDVDIVALREGSGLQGASPLPAALRTARDKVARDFDLPESWLNPGPSDLLDFGLPEDFSDRLASRSYGEGLVVHFASRLDQIHFKLYAAVDQGPGKHSRDLEAMAPTDEEMLQAARWTLTHDPSPEFKEVLKRVLSHYGVDDGGL